MKVLRTLALAAVIAVGACSDEDDKMTEPDLPTGQVPDFAAQDVNPTSARFEETVSPRDYEKSVSAWYFGHAT